MKRNDNPAADTERRAQKARTREAILAGARALIAEGEPVTVASAAQRADVSKATAYRYFSDPASLAAEAGLAIEVLPYEQIVAGASGPHEKVRAISGYMFDLALRHETAFRQFLARNLDARLNDPDSRRNNQRGRRRPAMFADALASVRPTLAGDDFETLVNALTAATGVEQMIVLLDVAEAEAGPARKAVLATTDALLDRYIGPEPWRPIATSDMARSTLTGS